jgi:hypothetical protein
MRSDAIEAVLTQTLAMNFELLPHFVSMYKVAVIISDTSNEYFELNP